MKGERKTVRAVIYRRVSEPAQAKDMKRSLQEQEESGRHLAEEHGHEVVQVYTDVEQGDYFERRELQAMLKDMRDGLFDVIIVWEPTRLARDPDIRATVRVQTTIYNVRLEYVKVPMASETTIEGKVVEHSFAMAGLIEKWLIGQRTQPMRRRRAQEGKLIPSSYPLYGYIWTRDERGKVLSYDIDPETAWVVRRIVEEVASAKPVRQIVLDLNRDGIPTRGEMLRRRGHLSPWQEARVLNVWTRNAIAALVNTPTYTGTHINYRRKNVYQTAINPLTGVARRIRIQTYRQIGETSGYEMTVPAIVPESLLLAAQARLAQNKQESPRSKDERTDALLRAGYVVCGYCDHPMAVQRYKTTPARIRYFCTGGHYMSYSSPRRCLVKSNCMHVNALDPHVWGRISEGLVKPHVLERLLLRAQTAVTEVADDTMHTLQALRAALKEADDQMAGLVQQSAVANLPDVAREALGERMREVGQTIERLRARIAEYAAVHSDQEAYLVRVREVVEWAKTVADGLAEFDYQQKRTVLYMLGARVYVYREDDPNNQTLRDGLRYRLETDFKGLNLGAELPTDSNCNGANNNARNYAVVNALDMQQLLGQAVGGGHQAPAGVAEVRRERDQRALAPAPTSDASE
jgi:DNA invertase Pin-like site-specific DNA recombinase